VSGGLAHPDTRLWHVRLSGRDTLVFRLGHAGVPARTLVVDAHDRRRHGTIVGDQPASSSANGILRSSSKRWVRSVIDPPRAECDEHITAILGTGGLEPLELFEVFAARRGFVWHERPHPMSLRRRAAMRPQYKRLVRCGSSRKDGPVSGPK
jgi:hypothetical protein